MNIRTSIIPKTKHPAKIHLSSGEKITVKTFLRNLRRNSCCNKYHLRLTKNDSVISAKFKLECCKSGPRETTEQGSNFFQIRKKLSRWIKSDVNCAA